MICCITSSTQQTNPQRTAYLLFKLHICFPLLRPLPNAFQKHFSEKLRSRFSNILNDRTKRRTRGWSEKINLLFCIALKTRRRSSAELMTSNPESLIRMWGFCGEALRTESIIRSSWIPLEERPVIYLPPFARWVKRGGKRMERRWKRYFLQETPPMCWSRRKIRACLSRCTSFRSKISKVTATVSC